MQDNIQKAKTIVDRLKDQMESVDKDSQIYKDVQYIYENSRDDKDILMKLLAYRVTQTGKYT